MNDRPIRPVQPVTKIKPLMRRGLPKKPTQKMLKGWRQALRDSDGPRLSDD